MDTTSLFTNAPAPTTAQAPEPAAKGGDFSSLFSDQQQAPDQTEQPTPLEQNINATLSQPEGHGFAASELSKTPQQFYNAEVAKGNIGPGADLKAGLESMGQWLEGNMFANLSRVLTGTDDYHTTVATNTALLNDIDGRMAKMVDDRKNGRGFDQRLWDEAVARRTYISNLQDQTIDVAATDWLSRIQKDPMGTLEGTWQDIKHGTTSAVDDPGKAFGNFIEGFIQDPELVFAGVGGRAVAGMTAVSTATRAAKAINALVNVGKSVGMSALKGGAIMAPINIEQQMNHANTVDPSQAVASIANGAVYGVVMGALHNVVGDGLKAVANKTGQPLKEVQDQFTTTAAANPTKAVADIYNTLGIKVPDEVDQNVRAVSAAGATYTPTPDGPIDYSIYDKPAFLRNPQLDPTKIQVDETQHPVEEVVQKDAALDELGNTPTLKGITVSDQGVPSESLVTPDKSGTDYNFLRQIQTGTDPINNNDLSYNEFLKNNPQLKPQAGNADLKLLFNLGLTGAGAMYGYRQGGVLGAIEYGLLGAVSPALVKMGASAMKSTMYSLRTIGNDHITLGDVGDLGNKTASALDSIPLVASRMKNYINAVVPDSTNLFKHLMGDPSATLSPAEEQVLGHIRTVMNAVGGQARNLGVIKNFVDEYFSRWYKPGPDADPKLIDDWQRGNFRAHRSLVEGYDGFKAALAKGLVPVTTNVGDITEAYLRSMMRAVEMRKFVDATKAATLSDGTRLVYGADSTKIPKGYVKLQGLMQGYKAHPDIAPELNFFLDFPDPSMLGKAYDMINFSMKRATLGMSLFHPMSLFRNYVFTTGRPWQITNAFNPNSDILQSIKYAPAEGEDLPMRAAKSGLVFSIKSTPEDFGNDAFYKPLDHITDLANEYAPLAGLAGKAVKSAFKLNDRIAFEMNQNFYKMHTWTILRQAALKKALNDHALDPTKNAPPDMDKIDRDTSSAVNDLFGGINWYRMASSATSWLGRNVMLDLFKPSNRLMLQRGVLAVDWSTSVIRSFVKAIPGIAENSQIANMHRRFLFGMGLTAFTLANAVNYAFSGKYIWQNDNPGYIDMGDKKMQWDKQLAEISEWVFHPGKAALNKMASLPKLGLEAAANRQYITPGEGAPKIYDPDDSFAKIMWQQSLHATGKFVPIAARQPDIGSAAGSFVGLPIYPNTGGGQSTSTSHNFGPPRRRNNKMY